MTALMTPGQRKQLKRLFEDGADWALDIVGKELTQKEAQRVLGRGNELRANWPELIRTLARGRYASEVVPYNFTYPPEFTGLKSIRDQVEVLMQHFPHLDPTWALEQGQQWYDGLKPNLPDWIEGPLVYIRSGSSYHSALRIILDKLAASRLLTNYREGQLDSKRLRQTELTKIMEQKLHAIQPGSFLIVPSQLGIRYRGSSVRRDRELFIPGEFGHSSLAVSCMVLTHPTRFVRWEQLHAICAGDEFSPGADGVFGMAPYFRFFAGWLEFNTLVVRVPDNSYGSVSAFLPQRLALAL